MKQPPKLATLIINRFAPDHDAMSGDLVEEYQRGRSSLWYWWQAISLANFSVLREICTAPFRAVAAILIGWASLLGVFVFLGDRTAYGLAAGIYSGWTHDGAYQTSVWWPPFNVASVFVSYAGFALSAWVVGRLSRMNPAAMVILYTGSVLITLAVVATAIQLYAGPVPVWHPLFYVISIALPYQGRSGFLIAPLVMLVAGLFGSRPSPTEMAR